MTRSKQPDGEAIDLAYCDQQTLRSEMVKERHAIERILERVAAERQPMSFLEKAHIEDHVARIRVLAERYESLVADAETE